MAAYDDPYDEEDLPDAGSPSTGALTTSGGKPPANGSATTGALSTPKFSIDDEIGQARANMETARAGALSNQNAEISAAESKRLQIQRATDALMATKPDKTALLFALSAGFLKPSVTGNFFENLGYAGANAAPIASDMETRRTARQKSIMDGQLSLADIDSQIAKIRGGYASNQFDNDADLYKGLLTIKQQQQAQNAQDNRTRMSASSVQEIDLTEDQAAAIGAPGPGIAKVQVDPDGNIVRYIGRGVTTADKRGIGVTLPATLQKAEDDDLNIINTAININHDLTDLVTTIDAGDLDLGLFKNWWNAGRNAVGLSSPQSVQYGNLRTTLERMRNDSLRLNNGVQTEGDAQRAWNELFQNLNDEAYVKERLKRIASYNVRAAQQRQQLVDRRRTSQGVEPLFNTGKPPAAGATGGWTVEQE